MKINGRFVVRDIAGDTVIVPVGETALKYNGMITTNKTGAALGSALENETDFDSLIRLLVEKYEVDQDTAASDVKAFLEQMRKAGLLEE